MRRTVVLAAVVLLASALVTASHAQQGGMGSQVPNTQPPASKQTPMPGGMCPMCSGMCPMMGGMQGGTMPMMGMMGGRQSESPRMVQVHGEMMKAMGKMMEGGSR